MPRDKSRTKFVATAEQVSRVADRFLRRSGKPVTKPMLLNDFAAEIMPGKNWGGLLAAASAKPSGEAGPARLAKIMSGLKPSRPDAAPIGARLVRFSQAGPLLADPPFLRVRISEALVEGAKTDKAAVAGMVIRVIGTHARAQFDTDFSVLLSADNEIFTEDLEVEALTAQAGAALLQVLTCAGRIDWSALLAAEGVSQGLLVLGPARCIGLIPLDLFDRMNADEGVGRMDADAVRLIADPDSGADAMRDTAAMARLISRALCDLALDWGASEGGDFRIDLDAAAPEPALAGAAVPGLPEDVLDHGIYARPGPRHEWAEAMSRLETSRARDFEYILGEALDLALRAQQVDCTDPLFIQAVVHDTDYGRNYQRHISADWKILTFQNGAFREWRLSREDADNVLRKNLLTWLRHSERTQVVPGEDMPEGSFELIAGKAAHLNANHWRKAAEMFSIAG